MMQNVLVHVLSIAIVTCDSILTSNSKDHMPKPKHNRLSDASTGSSSTFQVGAVVWLMCTNVLLLICDIMKYFTTSYTHYNISGASCTQ